MTTETWYEASFKLSNGKSFTIVHNINRIGNVNSIDAALDNWLARTQDYSAQSFVNYINSKHVHKAMTKKQYNLFRKHINSESKK